MKVVFSVYPDVAMGHPPLASRLVDLWSHPTQAVDQTSDTSRGNFDFSPRESCERCCYSSLPGKLRRLDSCKLLLYSLLKDSLPGETCTCNPWTLGALSDSLKPCL